MIRYVSLLFSNILLIMIAYFSYINLDNIRLMGKKLESKYIFLISPGISLYLLIITRKNIIKDKIKRYLSELIDKDKSLVYIGFGGLNLTLILINIYLAFLIYALVNNIIIFFIFIILALLLPKYIEEEIVIKYGERKKEIIDDLIVFITRISILLESGMVIRDAFIYSTNIKESSFFKLVRNAQTQINNGIHFKKALSYIYENARFDEVKKLINILTQSIDKGTNSTGQLKELRDDIKRERLINVRVKAGKISEKLLFPNILIFIGILLLILVPAFMNI